MGNKMASAAAASPQPIVRQAEPVSTAPRGSRRKPRGGGRGGGASPSTKRNLKSKPAIFFQAKTNSSGSPNDSFQDMGITEKVLENLFSKYGSLAKVDVRPKYG